MTPQLFGALVGRFPGPILVIGGGPSTAKDLPRLYGADVKPVAVISANEHGIHQQFFSVTHVNTADGVHHEKRKRMDVYIRGLGCDAPIISAAWFADYRLPDWRFAANTGLQAIALAVAMGGCPVIVTGLDFFRLYNPLAPTYYHDARAPSSSNKKTRPNFDTQIDALHAKLAGGGPWPIRPASGPMTALWPKFDPLEIVAPAPALPEFARHFRRMPTHVMQAHRSIRWQLWPLAPEPGAIVACSPLEASVALNDRRAKLVEILPASSTL